MERDTKKQFKVGLASRLTVFTFESKSVQTQTQNLIPFGAWVKM